MREFDLRALLAALHQHLKLLGATLEALDSTMPTVEGRPFDPDKDEAVILRGGNVTAGTRLPATLRATGLGTNYGSGVFVGDHVSGLLAPFPIIVSILAVFTHSHGRVVPRPARFRCPSRRPGGRRGR